MQKDVPKTPRLDWEQTAHTVDPEYVQKFHNSDSRNCVLLLLWSVGGLAFPLLGVGKVSTEVVYKVTYISLCMLQILQMLVSLKNHMSLYLICVITFHLTYFHG